MERSPVRMLVRSADAPGGVVRSAFTLAEALAPRHDVEVISLFRRRTSPVHPPPDGVRLTYLADHTGRRRRHAWTPSSRLVNPADTIYPQCSVWTDLHLIQSLRSMRGGVLVTTRPSLARVAARYLHPTVSLVAHEHMNAHTRPPALRDDIRAASAAGRLDALVVLTERDGEDWAHRLHDLGATRIRTIANVAPWPVPAADRGEAAGQRVVVAAGRLKHQKGFDRLIAVWTLLAARHSGWRLHIYGEGDARPRLQRLIDEADLGAVVELRGWTDDMRSVLDSASVFALSSRYEGLPMVAIEALSRGLPVVAFDCPRGPRELVDDGINGRLVPDNDLHAYRAALSDVLTDGDLRARFRRGARASAHRYGAATVGQQWSRLIDDIRRGSEAPGPAAATEPQPVR